MISVIRASDGAIKTFSSKIDYDFTYTLGESLEIMDTSFEEYASRFKLKLDGRSGETIRVGQGTPDIKVTVSCPGQTSVDVDVNGLVETIPLLDGAGEVILSTEVPGVFVLSPADRRLYCPAGEAVLTIEAVPNE